MVSFTTNWGLPNPAINDPSSTGSWGVTENTGRTLIDNGATGVQPLTVTGGTTVLTSTQGASDQSRQRFYKLTGALTGNALILMPQNMARAFSVQNACTGNFTVSFGANNGSGAAAGSVVITPQGIVVPIFSDGTNCFLDEKAGSKLQQSRFVETAILQNFNSATPSAYLSLSFTPIFAQSTIFISAPLNYISTIANNAAGSVSKMTASISRNGTALWTLQGGGAITGVAGLVLSPQDSLPLEWQEISPGAGTAVTYAILCSDANASGITNQALAATLLVQEYL